MSEKEIDIKAWAQQIRETKIRELRKYIKDIEKDFKKNQGTMFVVTRCHARARISELKGKLKFIENN